MTDIKLTPQKKEIVPHTCLAAWSRIYLFNTISGTQCHRVKEWDDIRK